MIEDQIINEWEAREKIRREKEDREKLRARASYLKNCMDYDDAYDSRPRARGLCFHKTRWNPRYVKGGNGFCVKCGADAGEQLA